MGKNVAVFVDVANIFYAAKAAGVDIDYVTLLKASTAGRDLVRAYAYTGLDPENENQRNFHDFLRRSNYKVVSKDIRKYGDGKVKANLDIELVVDMMKTARNLDIAIVVSGDGDFAPAIRAVQEQGVRVEVISFRGNTSSDLIDVADQFTDIVQLARVEKGTRSGRRVADGDDLSMTEVPDKQTEGTGLGRGRGRGRGRTRDAEPVAASGRSRSRGRSSSAAEAPAAAAAEGEAAGLVALPGERLSRAVGSLSEADLAKAEVFTLDEVDEADGAAADTADERADDGEEPRRRRRRGGRGRGRGRGRSEEGQPAAADTGRSYGSNGSREVDDLDEVPAPRAPRTTPFGSVWDSQLGTPAAATGTPRPPVVDDEDFDEPEIPEYLIAEQRRNARGSGGGRGARGGRSAYQSAMERERYGRGGGGGINRYPDVSGRSRQAPPRDDRGRGRSDRAPARADRAPAGRHSDEPWSDVPPELEAMLRAQVATKPVPGHVEAAAPVEDELEVDGGTAEAAEPEVAAPTRRRSTRKTAAATATDEPEATASKPRASRRTSAKATTAPVADDSAGATASSAEPAKATKPRASRATTSRSTTTRRTSTKASAATDAGSDGTAATPEMAAGGTSEAPGPKRRTTRKTATATETA